MKTQYATFCKGLKQEIAKAFPSAKTFKKVWVPAVGYVYYIKDAAGVTVAKAFRENCKMVVS